MPDFWSHIIGGELLLKKIEDKSWREMVSSNRTAFNFGCQGPDFYFYNDFWPWIRERRGPEAGRRIQQERTTSLFTAAAGFLRKHENMAEFPRLAAYFTGFLSHYLLDRWLHPFIRFRVDNRPIEHKNLEILIDCYLVNKYRGEEAGQLSPTAAIDLGKRLPPVILNFHREILTGVYGYPPDIGFIEDAYRDMKRVLGLFHRPGKLKKGLFLLLDRVLRQNITALLYPEEPGYVFLSRREWQEVDRRIETGLSEGRKMLKTVIDYLKGRAGEETLARVFPGINFDGEGIM